MRVVCVLHIAVVNFAMGNIADTLKQAITNQQCQITRCMACAPSGCGRKSAIPWQRPLTLRKDYRPPAPPPTPLPQPPNLFAMEGTMLRSDGLLKSAEWLLPEICRVRSAAAGCSHPKVVGQGRGLLLKVALRTDNPLQSPNDIENRKSIIFGGVKWYTSSRDSNARWFACNVSRAAKRKPIPSGTSCHVLQKHHHGCCCWGCPYHRRYCDRGQSAHSTPVQHYTVASRRSAGVP